jgi:DNA-binding MarR family transcriptional regulator
MHTSNIIVAWIISAQDRLLKGIGEVELDARELAALTLVATHDGYPMDWLRERVGLTQSGTVRLVDRLTARKLLRRGASSGRGVPLHLTGAGEQCLDRWRQARDAVVDNLLAGLTQNQRRDLVDAMAFALATENRVRREADATCRTCSWAECGQDCPVDRSVQAPETLA